MNISVVIPAYNEEKRIESTLEQISIYLENNFKQHEIIIVDDCSTDRTHEIILKYKSDNIRILRNDINKGKGFSVKRGIQNAQYPLVLFSDSDLATPIEELSTFVAHIKNGFDIIIASRNLNDSERKVKQPLYRQFMGLVFPLLVNLVVLRGFKDTQCGFKLFKTATAKTIVEFQTFNRFAFDVEILFIAKKLGYRIKEVPVVWTDNEGTTVRFFKDGFSMFVDLFKVRYNNIIGKYNLKCPDKESKVSKIEH